MASLQFSDDDFEEKVLRSDRPVIVDFWAEWCHPCRIVGPTIDKLAQEYKDKIIIGKLNVDENTMSPANYGVMSIPTVAIFHSGKVAKTLIGVQSEDTYRKAIEEVIAGT